MKIGRRPSNFHGGTETHSSTEVQPYECRKQWSRAALAALRAGIKTVLLPARNRKEFEDIPVEAREKLEFVWLERVDDALAAALT